MNTQKVLNLNRMTQSNLNLSQQEMASLDHQGLFDLLDTIEHSNNQLLLENKLMHPKYPTYPTYPTSKTKCTLSNGPLIMDSSEVDEDKICPDCYKDLVVEDTSTGIVVCTGCGTVLSTVIDRSPEWKQYDNDGGSSTVGRCSMPINYFFPQSSLGTSIAGKYMNNVKRLHSWSAMPYHERSLYLILKQIEEGCRRSGILKCIEDDAKILCKNISECKHIKGENKGKKIINRGKNRRGLIAACVFFACRRKGVTRSPKEIADIFNLEYTEITRGCKLFLKMMKLVTITYEMNTSTAEHFIPRFCHKLHLQESYLKQTVKIASNIQKLNVASVHTPLSIATGAILLMANINKLKHISKRMISEKFKVTEVTVSKTYDKLKQYKKILISSELTDLLVKLMEEHRVKAVLPPEISRKYGMVMEAAGDDVLMGGEDGDGDEDLDTLEDDVQTFDPIQDDLDSYVQRNSHLLDKHLELNTVEYQKICTEYCKRKRQVLKRLRKINKVQAN